MHQQSFANVPLWQFEQLLPYPNIKHFVSGRHGGVSLNEVGTFNLSFRASDSRENVIENRRRLAQALDIEPSRLVFPAQTHSDRVQLVTASTNPDTLTETDALITNTPGICICVMSADCVPILLYDPVTQSVGAVHAGWKGTVSKILTRTIEAMQQAFGTRPENLVAGIGPSISPEKYQVGSEVIEAVQQAFGHTKGLVDKEDAQGKGYLNLWEANRRQLQQLQVPEQAVEVAGICTYQQSQDFFSARKSANQAGRFAAGIMIIS
ncbi:peptidoglycan editing factor PgeF [Rhodocytophaga rosea]|uniref:Purine nucleoside phosphorylase n=1 Tax=Rhodocytophaga rosea TaxID=2704465 RepID=A0A6C0GN90_9BACT|nr:peptidoglycan editing factor PgeF [Rhodocytophaga rosea]QHT69407.1 peptidoglycan editing factor PgeF [Rhodocytophaga rosea]